MAGRHSQAVTRHGWLIRVGKVLLSAALCESVRV